VLPHAIERTNSSVSQDVSSAKLSLSQSLEMKYRAPGYQQQQQFQRKIAAVAITQTIKSAVVGMQDEEPRKPFTISDAMVQVKTFDKDLKTTSGVSRSSTSINLTESTYCNNMPSSTSPGVFDSNRRLRQMAEIMPTVSGTVPYSTEEVRRSILEVLDRDALTSRKLNPSQMSAVTSAILRPLTLIQGPPGTGKVFTG
jgi:hypothetical protein